MRVHSLIESLNGREFFDTTYHPNTMVSVRARIKEGKLAKVDKILDGIKNKMEKKCPRKLDYLRGKVTET